MCADPELRGVLLAELRRELAARRHARTNHASGKGLWRPVALRYGAPALACLLFAVLILR